MITQVSRLLRVQATGAVRKKRDKLIAADRPLVHWILCFSRAFLFESFDDGIASS